MFTFIIISIRVKCTERKSTFTVGVESVCPECSKIVHEQYFVKILFINFVFLCQQDNVY